MRAIHNFKNDNNIRVFALGGLGEVGKNMYCVQKNDEIIIIDAGILFPDTAYGINYVIPSFTYLKENESKIVGLFITHGHEDHIGAIPYLLKMVNIKNIYASGIAIGLIKNKLDEFSQTYANIIEYNDSSVYKFNNFEISFFRTNHSIPDSYGIAIKTEYGYIVHTGDFKFDFTPLGKPTDFDKIAKIGDEGVALLLADSTNANINKMSLSERKIGESIYNLFSNIKGRIIISTFASNVYRLQQIVEASLAFGRKVLIFGRSMEKTINVGTQMKYIKAPSNIFIKANEIDAYPDNKLTILSTGSQGEPLAALSRIADGSHKYIHIKDGDTIIFSSSAIPGNQGSINNTINKLYKSGANVIVNSPLHDTHTSGHASSIELQLMINLCKPKYFMPIHGEFVMLKRHVDLAIETGVKERNCFLLRNGEILTISSKKCEKKGTVPCGYISIDANRNIIDEKIVKERKMLADSGIVNITFNIENNHLLDKPHFNSRGFIYMKESSDLINEIETKAMKLANAYLLKHVRFSENKFKEKMEEELSAFIFEKVELKLPLFTDDMIEYVGK